ncbi:MAG: hypothetical protein WDZ41_05835 [Candidatus Babeliales bacterium]
MLYQTKLRNFVSFLIVVVLSITYLEAMENNNLVPDVCANIKKINSAALPEDYENLVSKIHNAGLTVEKCIKCIQQQRYEKVKTALKNQYKLSDEDLQQFELAIKQVKKEDKEYYTKNKSEITISGEDMLEFSKSDLINEVRNKAAQLGVDINIEVEIISNYEYYPGSLSSYREKSKYNEKSSGYIAFQQQFINDELQRKGMLSHELQHIKNYDMLIQQELQKVIVEKNESINCDTSDWQKMRRWQETNADRKSAVKNLRTANDTKNCIDWVFSSTPEIPKGEYPTNLKRKLWIDRIVCLLKAEEKLTK